MVAGAAVLVGGGTVAGQPGETGPGGAVPGLGTVPVDLIAFTLATLVAAYALARAIDWALTAAANRLATARFRLTLLIPVLKFVVYGATLSVLVTTVLSPTREQLVAFAGLFGAALGFGLKDLVADVFGGLVLVAEQPYRIGDTVSIGEHYGEVVDIGVRSTTIDTPNDTLVTVPNYLSFNESIGNANAGRAEMLVTVEFYVDPDSDAGEARRVVEDALLTSQYVYLPEDDVTRTEVLVEDDLHYRKLTGKAYVNDLRNEFRFRTEVTERVLAAFEKRGIESPRLSPALAEGVDAVE